MRERVPRRATLLFAAAACALTAGAGLSAQAPAQDADEELGGKLEELESNVDRQGDLQGQIQEQSEAISRLIGEESALRQREEQVQGQLDRVQAELDEATAALIAEQQRLTEVRARLANALEALEGLLVEMYKSSEADTLSVVLESASFEDLLTEGEYLDRIQEHDEAVITRVTALRAEVEASVASLTETRARIEQARDGVAARRAELAETRAQIDAQHAELAAARQARAADLDALQARESSLEKELGTSIPNPGERATLSGQTATAPPGAPLIVKAVIDAANEISDTPYVWGGGHGSFSDDGYDCSGAVSYALHGGGLIDSPLDSGGFTAWGSPGGGNWITVYANDGHVFMHVAGLRFDTGGNGGGSGPRWHTDLRSPAGFIPRHPEGF